MTWMRNLCWAVRCRLHYHGEAVLDFVRLGPYPEP